MNHILLAWITLGACPHAFAMDGRQKLLLEFEKSVQLVRASEQRLAAAKNSERKVVARECVQLLDGAKITGHGLGSHFFRYYRARLQIQAGDVVAARPSLLEATESAAMAPEALVSLYAVALAADDVRQQRFFSALLGKVLPTSVYGTLADVIERTGDGRAPVIPIVHTSNKKAVEIAQRFFEMKMHEEASIAFREAIYCLGLLPPPRLTNPQEQEESWLSPVTAPLWLRTAEAEWHLGNTILFADYLAKAIVFGGEAEKRQGLRLLELFRKSGVQEERPVATPDASKLQEIAQRYADLNMHPRSIQIVKRYGKIIGPVAKSLEEKYSSEWLELLQAYCAGVQGRCELFGQDVSRKENRLKVVIPPPCSKEALEEVAKVMKELK